MPPTAPPRPSPPSGIFQIASRLVFPALVIFSAAHLVNAELSPGDGFSAGLLLGLSIVLLYVGLGVPAVDPGMPRLARFGLVWGLSICIGLAVLPLPFGQNVLRTFGIDPWGFHLSTTLVFELGIFLVLAGGTLDLFRSIGLEADEEVP